MADHPDRLQEHLARLRARNQTKKVRSILENRDNVTVTGFVSGDDRRDVTALWRLFSDLSFEPFSTLPLSASDGRFKEWVSECYSCAGLSNPLLVSFVDAAEADLAEVEVASVGDWVCDLRNFLVGEAMNFDVIIASSRGDAALELCEEEHHYSAFKR